MNDDTVMLTRHKLDVDDIDRMLEAGILDEDDRVELIDGELIDMAPIGDDHVANVNSLTRALVMACGERAIVSVQNPLRLDRHNEPMPDFSVVVPRADFYRSGRAKPSEVLLVVEVAKTSLRYDRSVKLPIYARFGIGEVWIVDLKAGVLEAYRWSANGGYPEPTIHRAGERLALALAPEIMVPLGLVFG